MKNYIRMLVASLIGAAAVVEYYIYSGGHTAANATVYFCSLMLAFFLAVGLPPKGARERGFQFFLMGSILAISLTFVLFDNRGLRFTNSAVLILLTGILFLQRIGVERCSVGEKGFLPEVFMGYFLRPFTSLVDMFEEGKRVFVKSKAEGDVSSTKNGRVILQIGIALLVGIPLILFLTGILMASDQIFEEWFEGAFEVIADWLSFGTVNRIILTLVLLPFSASVLFGYAKRSVSNRRFKEEKVEKPVLIPAFSAITLLVLINALYLLYAVVQSVYLFGAWSGNLPGDLSYAEYARKGFFELAFISAINAIMILAAIRYTQRGAKTGRTVRVLSILLIVLSFVQLFSAFRRMTLYISAYGLSEDRFLVSGFMVLVGILFIMLGIREFSERFPLLKASLIAGILALFLVNACVPGRIVASYNVRQYLNGELDSLDTRYLQSMSSDSLIVILSEEEKLRETGDERILKSMDEIHDFISVYYLGEKYGDFSYSDRRYDPYDIVSYRESTEMTWKGFNLSKHRLLMAAEED